MILAIWSGPVSSDCSKPRYAALDFALRNTQNAKHTPTSILRAASAVVGFPSVGDRTVCTAVVFVWFKRFAARAFRVRVRA
jgi:hypothetical protein